MATFWAVNEDSPPQSPQFVTRTFKAVIPYVTQFLVAKHPHRNGVMCPFMPKALQNNDIYFTYFPSELSDKNLLDELKDCVRFFKQRGESSHGAVIVLLEEDFDILRLHRLHIDAKLMFIKNELMLGALHKDSSAPSLHSPDYFPLRTPSPTLVIRDLTPQDLMFLEPGHYGSWAKVQFLSAYVRKFSTAKPSGYTAKQVDVAIKIRRRYYYGYVRFGIMFSLAVTAAITLCYVIGG